MVLGRLLRQNSQANHLWKNSGPLNISCCQRASELYPASAIVSQMKAFKDGSRPATVMARHAKGYSDEDIAALAKYIGIQGQ